MSGPPITKKTQNLLRPSRLEHNNCRLTAADKGMRFKKLSLMDSRNRNSTQPAQIPQGNRALLWPDTAEGVVKLHPAAYPESLALAVSQDSQVGTGIFSSVPDGERHALLWHGTADSVVDLHPTGFIQTDATGVAGTLQFGWGQGAVTGGQNHALLWAGNAASFVDGFLSTKQTRGWPCSSRPAGVSRRRT